MNCLAQWGANCCCFDRSAFYCLFYKVSDRVVKYDAEFHLMKWGNWKTCKHVNFWEEDRFAKAELEKGWPNFYSSCDGKKVFFFYWSLPFQLVMSMSIISIVMPSNKWHCWRMTGVGNWWKVKELTYLPDPSGGALTALLGKGDADCRR